MGVTDILFENLNTGAWYLRECFVYAAVVYAVVFIFMALIKKRKIRGISVPKYIVEFLFILWCFLILRVTGLMEISYFEIPSFRDIAGSFCQIPFLGHSFSMIVLNGLLFVPFGFLLPIVFVPEKVSWKKGLLAGSLFSVCIEICQLFTGRMFEWDDILANSFGALFGFLCVSSIYDTMNAEAFIMQICRNSSVMRNACTASVGGVRSKYDTMHKDSKKNGSRKNGFRKMAVTVAAYGAGLFLLFFLADAERVQNREEKEYPGISEDAEAYDDIAEMRLFSKNGILLEKGVSDNGTFDTAFMWMAERIDSGMSSYQEMELKRLPELGEKEKISSDYIEVIYAHPHTFKFINKKDFEMSDVQYLLYDVRDGALWYGRSGADLSGYLEYVDEKYPFQPDEDLMALVESEAYKDFKSDK